MYAREILESLDLTMSKAAILSGVKLALADLELLNGHQVAERLGVAQQTVKGMATKHNVGYKLHKLQKVFFPSDVEILRGLIGGPPGRPRTISAPDRVEEMRGMREGGATLRVIADEVGCSESYVSKLLKQTIMNVEEAIEFLEAYGHEFDRKPIDGRYSVTWASGKRAMLTLSKIIQTAQQDDLTNIERKDKRNARQRT